MEGDNGKRAIIAAWPHVKGGGCRKGGGQGANDIFLYITIIMNIIMIIYFQKTHNSSMFLFVFFLLTC